MGKGIFLIFFGVVVCLVNTGVFGETQKVDNECVSGDTLACVQYRVFRTMKTFFDMNRVDLIGGLSIVKDKDAAMTGRRSAKSLEIEKSFDVADDFEKRQTALETFAVENVLEFLQGRSLQWNPSNVVETVTSTVRSLAEKMPAGVQKFVTQLMTEGRGRKKHLQKLLPLLIGIKMKLGTSIILAALGIALIAKKAILASFISLAVSTYIIIKKLLAHHYHHHPYHHGLHEAHHGHHIPWAVSPVLGGAYSSPVAAFGASSGGWDAATSYNVNDDTYGSHSSPVAHKMVFGAQKPKRR